MSQVHAFTKDPSAQTAIAATADLAALKNRQQVAWSSGDYAVVGTTLQIVGEQLCEALDLRAGQKVRMPLERGGGLGPTVKNRKDSQATANSGEKR